MPIRLFVGLGNPEDKYKNTRHNFGFEVLDAIAKDKNIAYKKWNDVAGISVYDGGLAKKVFLLKPMTYMNNSGDPISAFMKYHKISPQEIFVFYDDLSIPIGKFKIKLNGSSAGHNGLKSIIAKIDTQEFARMKLGISPRPENIPAVNFVLSKFSKEDKDKIDCVIDKAVEIFDDICNLDLEKAVSKIKGI
jgi:PTH1 family peptidyl-tRNA hydrolase